MRKILKSKKWLTALAVLACLGALVWVVAAIGSAPSGAIFTTDVGGEIPDGNIYDLMEDVYINGGPPFHAGCNGAAGLPEGDYYFQVTDPAGTELLSKDDLGSRRFHVANGVIEAYTPENGYPATHVTGPGKCSPAITNVTIQLMEYDPTPNPGGEYKVWVIPVAAYIPGGANFGFPDGPSKTDNFKVRFPGGGVTPPETEIIGLKFYDANTNGKFDPGEGEVGIQGWRIEKTPPAPADVTPTNAEGEYSFLVEAGSGWYTISEVMPQGSTNVPPTWVATTPQSGEVNVDGAGTFEGPDFGNVCLGAGNGKTLGYWSNKNGKAKMTKYGMAEALGVLAGLHLRDAAGADFDPTDYSIFRTWLLDANAKNMAYMLSAQLAAMRLNVLLGIVDETALIYAPGTSSANPAGFATVSAIIAEANAALADPNGYTPADHPERSHQEALKNALDNANNNNTFVQPTPCPVEY